MLTQVGFQNIIINYQGHYIEKIIHTKNHVYRQLSQTMLPNNISIAQTLGLNPKL